MMVFIFSIFVLTIIQFTNSALQNTMATPINTFLNSMKDICPQLASNEILLDPKQLQQCQNCDLINSTMDLNDNSEQNVLCLLYYDNFISFCEKMKKYNNTINSSINFNVTPVDIDTICEKGLVSTDRLNKQALIKKINKKVSCYKLCASYDNDAPVYECAMAHYFAHFNFSSLERVNKSVPLKKKTFNGTEESSGNNVLIMENNKSKLKNDTQSSQHLESTQNQVPVTLQSNVSSLNNSAETQQVSNESLVTRNTNSKSIQQHLAESQTQKTLDQKDKKDSKGLTDMNTNLFNSKSIQQHLAEFQTQKTLDQKDKKDSKGITDMNTNPDQSQINPAIQQEPISNNKQDNHASVSNKNPQNDDSFKIQEGDAIQKTISSIAPEGAEGNIKIDAVEQNEFEEAETEGIDPGLDGELELPFAVEKPQQQDQDKPHQQDQDELPMMRSDGAEEIDGDSYFFSYFMVICVVFILGYVGYHNRLKVMALVLEGKRNKRQYRGRRPNSANYHKLDCNLEEAISSNVTKNSSNVIY